MSVLLVDTIGRKWSHLITAIPFIVSSIMIGFAPSYWWLVCARFIAGLGCGWSFMVAAMYLGEIANDEIRGALAAMISHMLNAGILLTYAIGPWVSRLGLACLGIALPVAFGLLYIWMPESPYYLVMKNNSERATKSLQWLKGSADVKADLAKVEQSIEFDRQNSGSFKDLLIVPGNRRALIIVLGLMVAQQFSGINAVLAYSGLIFEEAGSKLGSSVSVIIVGAVQVFGGILCIFTVDLAGRKPLLLISAGGSIFCLGGVALYFQLDAVEIEVASISWLPLVGTVGYIIFYTVGLGLLPYVILSEIFPYNVKAFATMATSITGAIGGMAVSKLYQVVADAWGIHTSFWGFAGITVGSIIFIIFVVPETKQRSLQEIQEEFHPSKRSNTSPSDSAPSRF
ncbi:facilitated trehalose transporter Tret1-2 homolog [Athalia rosae]|uniref:facilitated trehalose transporter Tret1-2 homolog n=1 Tax=Athalia rosae TaxID=37344 RepID=UPI0020348D7E|nr:facilitated trehalose transporter Tret1-2 homolog [Athalia rosae]